MTSKKKVALKTPTDAQLAARIVKAIKLCDEADATSKEKAVSAGKLLAEAHQRHQGDEAFTACLEESNLIGIRRARDLIAIARDPETRAPRHGERH
jgi:hypothetical protein